MKTTFYVFASIALLTGIIILVGKLFGKRNNIHSKPEWGNMYKEIGATKAGFEVYEQSKERAYYYDSSVGNTRVPPASTFKVFLSLVALETSVAPSEDMEIMYDATKPSNNPAWNKTMTMREAFEVDSEPYFRTLAQRIGKAELKRWLDSVRYGNTNIGNLPEDCHLDGSLLITPDEQVGFMKRLYFDQLPFSKRAQRIVRTMLVRETENKYKLSHKTGMYHGKDFCGNWVVGYLEDSTNHPYFFSSYYETKDTSVEKNKTQSLDVVRKIFNTMGLMYK